MHNAKQVTHLIHAIAPLLPDALPDLSIRSAAPDRPMCARARTGMIYAKLKLHVLCIPRERKGTMSETRDWNAEIIAEFRANNGVVKAPYDNPPPMLLLHTIGAKSGKQHIVPMRTMPDGEVLY